MKRKPKSDYAIQTVSNALRLLEAFRDEQELGVTELARRLSLHKNNVFRLLATLEQRGYVEQTRSERYRLAVRSLELGHAYARGRGLLERARPILEDLAAETGESAHLAVMQEFEVVHVEGAVTERIVHCGSRVGRRLPVHCTALGKVLLGCALESVRETYDRELASRRGLEARTHHTIVDRDKLFEHLRTVAGQGYAVDLEECELGLRCAAAPVVDASGRTLAAFSVSGPAFRLDDERLLGPVTALVAGAAERLSRELGHAS